jgi:hypothetical protein
LNQQQVGRQGLVRPNLAWIGLVWINVNHPIENLWEPAAARLLTDVLRYDRTLKTEFLPVNILN